ncbi:MAG: endonuclease Q family protein [Candidatus Aenigmatarchaeota archaeon]|nr:endonuclease Q family protein [Candidatus Aenigmarchaeota archaeon]
MEYIADFHLHSKYSRATSRDLSLETLSEGAKIKGLNLLSAPDFTHPIWLKELRSKLIEEHEGIFNFNGINFILTTEIATIETFQGKTRHVHHNIHAPSFDVVDQINEALGKFGDLKADGRPMLTVSPAEIVEILMQISKDILIYPNHAWTPWRSVFGSINGYNSLEECYQDQSKHIFALETGLSSDPPMNWMWSKLDEITLLSNSDAHSANPWRLGREANVFELDELTYNEINDAIKKKDKKKFLFTIEVPPEYGKYHITGHRRCNVSMHPKDAIRINNRCPRCRKKMTIGVLQRVEELADRERGFVPKNAIPFKTLLPLYEIISFVAGTGELYSKKVVEEQNKLINKFGSELNVLLNVSREELVKVTNEKIAEAIIKVREGKVRFNPGYDGFYGIPIFDDNIQTKESFVEQKSLTDF